MGDCDVHTEISSSELSLSICCVVVITVRSGLAGCVTLGKFLNFLNCLNNGNDEGSNLYLQLHEIICMQYVAQC